MIPDLGDRIWNWHLHCGHEAIGWDIEAIMSQNLNAINKACAQCYIRTSPICALIAIHLHDGYLPLPFAINSSCGVDATQ